MAPFKNFQSVCLLSGGLDSSLALARYLSEGGRVVKALTFDYGQKSARRECKASAKIARHFGVAHEVVQLPWVESFPSALVDRRIAVPSVRAKDLLAQKKTVATANAVWVPNRNGLFIELAAGFAESLRAHHVIVGFNREEAATFPDNSAAYVRAVNRSLKFSTRGQVQVVAPFIRCDKEEIIAWGEQGAFPWGLLWSCYLGGKKMCGVCESCVRLRRAARSGKSAGSEVSFAV